jgi:hypothetical protein
MSGRVDYTGHVFGRLTVIEPLHAKNNRYSDVWICECSCKEENKNTVRVLIASLKNGHTRSCGCLHREAVKAANTKHGMRHSPEYKVWEGMKARCYNPNNKHYSDYGGRGITVCEEWQEFAAFYRDMGSRPTSRHTLERNDNDGPYCKSNCKWATRKEQARNKRNNVYYEYKGERKLLGDWCRELNLKFETISTRLRAGWSFADAISTPPQSTLISHSGEEKSLGEWCRELGLNYNRMHYLLRKGLSFEEAIKTK